MWPMPGEAVEAKDRCGIWYNAKIVAVRGEGNQIAWGKIRPMAKPPPLRHNTCAGPPTARR